MCWTRNTRRRLNVSMCPNNKSRVAFKGLSTFYRSFSEPLCLVGISFLIFRRLFVEVHVVSFTFILASSNYFLEIQYNNVNSTNQVFP